MAKHGPQIHDQPIQEEDYIDMDLSSPAASGAATTTASLFCYNSAMAASPQHSREFEFHMSAPPDLWEPVASPADELFYKGKLLPLHLPPRIQMVEKLLESASEKGLLSASTAPATPYQSAANSCYASSGELAAEYYFHECISTGSDAAEEAAACEKKPWSKKLKFIRHLNLGLKLKASKAYLKTIFASKGGNPGGKNGVPGANELSSTQFNTWRKNPFGHIGSKRYIASPISNSTTVGGKFKEGECGHRRSFSSIIIRYSSSNKTSSVSSSSSCSSSNSSSFSIPSSNGSGGVGPVLRRSSSASSEMDNPIQGAIAYCKKSQQLASVRKSASDAGFRFMSSSASKIAAESEDADGIFEITRNTNVNSVSPQ
ncbi:probable membrane-associated kinase regulator 4 [Zea mays]|uniref:Putative membrane-associated kinase regulator 4 n=1 Tax=Zea mays TaxID=4577 RepID=A0A1D6N7N0_MAIZE|nr:probable membrane-associated kinase regulator 4 [Zea mays]ONM36596.1 putative membrane-associated kinase regulator 4 [Zea mays]|eukprot:XP_008674852.1 probable membrane-associated kinase regulator 4 [Zea mays]